MTRGFGATPLSRRLFPSRHSTLRKSTIRNISGATPTRDTAGWSSLPRSPSSASSTWTGLRKSASLLMPRLETPRLLLRPLQASDVAVLIALWADPDVTSYMGGPRETGTVRRILEDELRTGSADAFGFYPVVEKTSGRVIGDCGLTKKDVDGRDEVELVYVFAADAWGQGYATEAACALRDYARGPLKVRRLIALIDPENTASARVAEKVGMQFERAVVRPGCFLRHVSAMHVKASVVGDARSVR